MKSAKFDFYRNDKFLGNFSGRAPIIRLYDSNFQGGNFGDDYLGMHKSKNKFAALSPAKFY
jgi:hypothetical protein